MFLINDQCVQVVLENNLLKVVNKILINKYYILEENIFQNDFLPIIL